jgi:hypothetical protein
VLQQDVDEEIRQTFKAFDVSCTGFARAPHPNSVGVCVQ